jgi:hypothetical protein
MRFLLLARIDGSVLSFDGAATLAERARGARCDALAMLSREDTDLYLDACREWVSTVAAGDDRCIPLVRPRRPPVVFARDEQPVESFVCAGAFCREAVVVLAAPDARAPSVFDVVHHAMLAAPAVRLRVCETAEDLRDAARVSRVPGVDAKVEWSIPHFGPIEYLRGCLAAVAAANEAVGGVVAVGLDDPAIDDDAAAAAGAEGRHCRTYRGDPPRSGCFAIKRALMTRSEADIVIFQDSDDVPTDDRAACLAGALLRSTAGLAGSHALNVDLRTRQIIPTRYPLDATAALRQDGESPLLHGASAIRRQVYLDAGGFSSHAAYAMDTQFLLRSFFHTTAINVDRFLYLRRLRSGTLTSDAATSYGSLERERFNRRWTRDFDRVRRGELALEASSLRPMTGARPATLHPLRASPRMAAIDPANAGASS